MEDKIDHLKLSNVHARHLSQSGVFKSSSTAPLNLQHFSDNLEVISSICFCFSANKKKEKCSAIIWTKWLFSTKPRSVLCQYIVDIVGGEMGSETLNVHQAFPEIWIFWLTGARSIPGPGKYSDGEEPEPGWRSHHGPSGAAGSKCFYHVALPVVNMWACILAYFSQ